MRFDMRAPESGAPIAELYRAALEMASWGEAEGCLAVQVSEHEGPNSNVAEAFRAALDLEFPDQGAGPVFGQRRGGFNMGGRGSGG